MLVRLESQPLWIRPNEAMDVPAPKFTKYQIESMHISSVPYTVGMDTEMVRYDITLPNGAELSISRHANHPFYGNAASFVNECTSEMSARKKSGYTLSKKEQDVLDWIRDNATDLNISREYWSAIAAAQKAELMQLKANIRIINLRNYIDTGEWLPADEIKRIVTEYGYDPEKSWGYAD